MKKKMALVAALGLSFILAPGFCGPPANAASKDLKKMMGSNFGTVQKILIDLVKSDYSQVGSEVALIEEHATELTKAVPPSGAGNRENFVAMAYTLQTHARHLGAIVKALVEREKGPDGKTPLRIDYLRNTAAAHFGNMVTACVACHNQFRRTVVP